MDYGRRYRHFREMAGLTQKEAAELLGINNYQLANYENNRSEPNIATLKKMSKVYDVSLDGLLGNMRKPKKDLPKEGYVDMDELIGQLNEVVEQINKVKK